ncbi:MAG TPA: hypothetical protein VHK90_15470 [Thermoanaerobaculia bacterium]|nr:hypothetical protein [Thermoanaerobaculia bacterium]
MTRPPVAIFPLASRSNDVRVIAASLLETPRHFDGDELKRRGWVVVPFADAFTEEQAASLAAAAARRGVRSAVALTTEPEVNEEQFEVPMTPDGIMAFDRNCLLRYFLLVPHDVSFAVLHEANYYWLLAAPPDFLEQVVGTTPLDAFESFIHSYVDSPDWPEETTRMLAEIERYRVLL